VVLGAVLGGFALQIVSHLARYDFRSEDGDGRGKTALVILCDG
jgi:hypothetical protein